jgi:SAM-dependent methyltransferase
VHKSALAAGRLFFETYFADAQPAVLDVGAMDVNGSLRSVAPAGTRSTGADLAPGNGVDLVLTDPYQLPFPDGGFDAVVSTSCFEHDSFFWLTFLECLRVLRPGGYFYLNAPSNGIYHTYPDDNWRFYPDAGRALVKWAKRNNVDVEMTESFILNQDGDIWNDFVAVFCRGAAGVAPSIAPTSGMHTHFPGATNVWVFGAAEIARKEVQPQDQRQVGITTKLMRRVRQRS